MTDDPISLAEQRANRAEDNTLWTPLDCAKAFARDITNGTIKPKRVLMIYEEDLPDGGACIRAYRANVPRDSEITMLWLKLFGSTMGWMRPD